jgi:hypothetical protein
MYIRCPSQRDAEDWVRCFAQIYEEEIIEPEYVDISQARASQIVRMEQAEQAREETPKWADDANKLLKMSENWNLAGENLWIQGKYRKSAFVVNSGTDFCLEALLDRRGEWDFLLKSLRKIATPANARVYHCLFNNQDLVLLGRFYLDLPLSIIVNIESVKHSYYNSSLFFEEVYFLVPHSFAQNSTLVIRISTTEKFDESFPSLKNYVEIANFKNTNTEIHHIPLNDEADIREEPDYSKPIDFNQYFIYGPGGDYERDPVNGGLLFLDYDLISKQRNVLSNIIKRMGKNLLSGKSIMGISMPVYIFAKTSMLQQLANMMGYTPVFLEKAAQNTGLERFKYVVTSLVAILHIATGQRKPFNPIIGETYQGYIGKSQYYAEQVSHHPPISSFQIYHELYSMFGYYEFTANTSANSVKARQIGLTCLKIDKNEYFATLPFVHLSGTLFGKRYYNWQGYLTVVSPSENLYCEIQMNPDKKGALSGMFSKQQTPSDYFQGSIWRVKDSHPVMTSEGRKALQDSAKKNYHGLVEEVEGELSKIEGYWTLHLDIDNKRYWSFDEFRPYLVAHANNPLPSDSRFRLDLKAWIEDNQEEAQAQKDILENLQRRDNKIRHERHK